MVTSHQIHWVAGFLEGEGCFWTDRIPTVSVGQVQMEPLLRLQGMFGGRITKIPKKKPTYSQAYMWRLTGRVAIGLMMSVYGIMSPRRKEQILVTWGMWKAQGVHPKYWTKCKYGHEDYIWQKEGGKMRRRCHECAKAQERKYMRGVRARKKQAKLTLVQPMAALGSD